MINKERTIDLPAHASYTRDLQQTGVSGQVSATMNSTPLLSIVICSYNNADSLFITLSELTQQILPDDAIAEVILVDNNSSDHTAAVFRQISEQSPVPMFYVLESRQGLSYARNTGVEKAKGQYILFTDDDAELPKNWVAGYLTKIAALTPDCLYSKINIIWDRPVPWWYSQRYRPFFVGLDYGDRCIKIEDNKKEFFGKNFCIKKSLLLDFGGFDPALGRSGSRLIAGEETLIYRKLVEQRKNIFYFPDSAVGHRLKEREYRSDNIHKQFMDSAYSAYHIAKLTARRRLWGRPLTILIHNTSGLMTSLIFWPLYCLVGNKKEVFFHNINIKRSLLLLKLWVKST